jgi:hypothetical protein
LASKDTQDDELARWNVRLETANTANQDAQTALSAATTAYNEGVEQVTTRAWIYSVLGMIDSSLFDGSCDAQA